MRTLLDSPTHLKLTTRFGAAVSLLVDAEENRAQSSCATQSHSSMQAPRCSYSVIRSEPAPGRLTTATRWDESGEKDKWVTRGEDPVGAAEAGPKEEGMGTGSEMRTRGVAASAPEKWVKWIDGVPLVVAVVGRRSP